MANLICYLPLTYLGFSDRRSRFKRGMTEMFKWGFGGRFVIIELYTFSKECTIDLFAFSKEWVLAITN